jgi:uncharacterized protein YuzE
MAKVKVFYDKISNSLVVWFDEAKKEAICEEIDDDTVLMKDKKGNVIGFEKLNFVSPKLKTRDKSPVQITTSP